MNHNWSNENCIVVPLAASICNFDDGDSRVASFCEYLSQQKMKQEKEKEEEKEKKQTLPISVVVHSMSDIAYQFISIAEYFNLPTLTLFDLQNKLKINSASLSSCTKSNIKSETNGSAMKKIKLTKNSSNSYIIPPSLSFCFGSFAYCYGLDCAQLQLFSFAVPFFALAFGFWSLSLSSADQLIEVELREERNTWMLKAALLALAALDQLTGVSHGAERVSYAQQMIDSEKKIRYIIHQPIITNLTIDLAANTIPTSSSLSVVPSLASHSLSIDKFFFLLKGNIIQAHFFKYLGTEEQKEQHQHINASNSSSISSSAGPSRPDPNYDIYTLPPDLKSALDVFFTTSPLPDITQCEQLANLSIHFDQPAIAYIFVSRGLSIQLAQPISRPDHMAHLYRKLLTVTITPGQAIDIFAQILKLKCYPLFSLTESQWFVADCWNRGVIAVNQTSNCSSTIQQGKGLLAMAMELLDKAGDTDNEGGGMNEGKLKQKQLIKDELRKQWECVENRNKVRGKLTSSLLTKQVNQKKDQTLIIEDLFIRPYRIK